MKKILILIVLLLFTTPAFAATAEGVANTNNSQMSTQSLTKSVFQISVIDPTPQTNKVGAFYPGVRGANQLIIYTPRFGERTQTNEFGKEVVVKNGVVTDITGSNSLIPKNGFVISGHGAAKKWIDDNIMIGSEIKIDPKTNTITSAISPDSYLFNANQKINKVYSLISQYKVQNRGFQAQKSLSYLKAAKAKLKLAQKFSHKNDLNTLKNFSTQSASLADTALYFAMPSLKNEFHGIWMRPTEKNAADIGKTLDRIKSAGIDNVFIETYIGGYTIFPSDTLKKYGVTSQKKEFVGFDPLEAWVNEAHKRSMKIFVWFQTFYAGNEDLSKNPNNVISVHPDWANVQRRYANADRPMPSVHEHNGYFLDPANPMVQQYLQDLLCEIVTKYAIDGLNIDYIRYPVSLARTFPNYLDTTWGYTKYARAEFQSLYGVDPANLTLSDPLWQKWIEYRQNKVTSFVSKLKTITDKKNITISTVMFPDPEESAIAKLQKWGDWGNNCYVDAFTPLIMGNDSALASDYVDHIRNTVGNKVKIYAGLFEPFTTGTPADLMYQIKAVRDKGANGVVIFDYAHTSDEFINALNSSVFRNEPHQ